MRLQKITVLIVRLNQLVSRDLKTGRVGEEATDLANLRHYCMYFNLDATRDEFKMN